MNRFYLCLVTIVSLLSLILSFSVAFAQGYGPGPVPPTSVIGDLMSRSGSDATSAALGNLVAAAGGTVSGALGGTGVANTGKTITLGGSLSTIGAFDTILRATAATDVTLPTTGTLATLAGAESLTGKTQLAITAPVVNTTPLTISGYSLTGSDASPMVSLAGTTNTTGTVTLFDINWTDTASGAESLFMDLRWGGGSRFKVDKTGAVTSFAAINSGSHFTAAASGVFQWASGDLALYRDAAGILAQRNGANAQTFRWYYTYTDASNYQRGALNTGSDYVEVAAETLGTGADNLDVRLTPAGTGSSRIGGGIVLTGAAFANCTSLSTVSGVLTCVP